MEEIKNLLDAREKQLLQLKKEKEKSLLEVPQGSLRISNYENHPRYYHRRSSKDVNGNYIRDEDMQLAYKLAQKDYDAKVLCAVDKELCAIRKYFSAYPAKSAEQIYEGLHRERQKLVFPIRESDEEFVDYWKSVEYQGKDFYLGSPEYSTMNGEKVRSKSEWIIADILHQEGIPYRYEYPIYLDGFGQVYPDFTLLKVRTREEIYYEHFGMMDDPDYAEKAIQKIASYEQNGIFPGEKLLLSFETRKNPISPKQIQLMIRRYFQ